MKNVYFGPISEITITVPPLSLRLRLEITEPPIAHVTLCLPREASLYEKYAGVVSPFHQIVIKIISLLNNFYFDINNETLNFLLLI